MNHHACDASHPQVGRLGRIVAIVCFFHCVLFLALLLALTLEVIPGAERWLPFVDNMMFHLVLGGVAITLVGVHLLLHRAAVSRKSLSLAVFGASFIVASVVGESALHAHIEESEPSVQIDHEHGPACTHHDHPQVASAAHLPKKAASGHTCFSEHRQEHLALHFLFMAGNVCLFLVHGLVRCKPAVPAEIGVS